MARKNELRVLSIVPAFLRFSISSIPYPSTYRSFLHSEGSAINSGNRLHTAAGSGIAELVPTVIRLTRLSRLFPISYRPSIYLLFRCALEKGTEKMTTR